MIIQEKAQRKVSEVQPRGTHDLVNVQEAPERHGGNAGNAAPSQGTTSVAAARRDVLSACIAGVGSCQSPPLQVMPHVKVPHCYS